MQAAQATPFFECALCRFKAPYEKFGRTLEEDSTRSGKAMQIVFMEDCFLVADPNALQKRPLALGSKCSQCERMVCHDPGCSLFYAKRFCGPCAAQNKPAFPQQLHQVAQKIFAPAAGGQAQAKAPAQGVS